MAGDSANLIDFDVIEGHKENIQSLPSGRSATALASIYSPPLSTGKIPTTSDTQDLNNTARQEFEKELLSIEDSDDPLDIYDRYVKWTLDAYPSAQATPQSQLLPLLERATKAFLSSPHYKNDSRYLKLWLHYIRFFSDTPRETFAFLARHGVGDSLALFYEEFSAWLESNGRYGQADEVYRLGIDRNARPTERLVRKYGEFQHRFETQNQGEGPSSPALPTVRTALVAKVDPFASASTDPQAQDRANATHATSGTKSKNKLAIFSDSDNAKKPEIGSNTNGWDSIGTMAERRKENVVEAKPWAGETIKGTFKRNTGVPKMMIFKDQTSADNAMKRHPDQQTVNPRTGRIESVFVNLEAVYPNPEEPEAEEFCFEELRAQHRGWLDVDWMAQSKPQERQKMEVFKEEKVALKEPEMDSQGIAEGISNKFRQSLILNDENAPPSEQDADAAAAAHRMRKQMRKEERANRTRKIRVMEVKGQTQTVQTNLASPTGPKLRKKKNAEPTMTVCTREAMDEIYDIFNQPLKSADTQEEELESDISSDDDDYTSGGESTGTGRISGATSDFGDETTAADFTESRSADFTESRSTIDDDELTDNEPTTTTKSVSAWSDFDTNKHVPNDFLAEDVTTSTRSSEDVDEDRDIKQSENSEEVTTPTSPGNQQNGSASGLFIPEPPEDCEVPTRPYRDPLQVAQNKLPFMTPIVEKTESSIGAATAFAETKDYFNAKTPCRPNGSKTPIIPEVEYDDDDTLDKNALDSPFRKILKEALKAEKENQKERKGSDESEKAAKASIIKRIPLGETQPTARIPPKSEATDLKPKGPIIQDLQCNPVSETVREVILSQIQPPLASYDGYSDSRGTTSSKSTEIKKFARVVANKSANPGTAPSLRFDGGEREYIIKRELGKGAFAPVYLAESRTLDSDEEAEKQVVQMGKGDFAVKRSGLEAIKMEEPPSAWEFYMIRQAQRRLGVNRATDSIINAYEMRMFKDECFLVEEYRDQGTLLNLINYARADPTTGGVMDELCAMFFTVELFRTVEAMHSKGLLHGDLKADNVLVRFDAFADAEWKSTYARDGRDGWSSKGISLIDFGRGIDMRVFKPDVQFIADWKTTEADCAEMREMRPWTYQIDYHGLAGIVHTLLFGKYIETIAEKGGALGAGATKTYRIRDSFKRYWQTEIWSEVMDLLLNPLMHLEGEEGRKLPVLRGMKACRVKMEDYLETNCEKGLGLKQLIRRMEQSVHNRRR